MTSLVLQTPPALEPVTLAEFKSHARIDGTADDILATGLIIAARQWVEQYTRRALITQTWRLWLDAPPDARSINLPHSPVLTVNSLQYFDEADAATVWSIGNYFVDLASQPARLALRNGAVWPLPIRSTNGLMIEYSAGYGATAAAVPEALKLAIKQIAAHWYEQRGDAVTAGIALVPLTALAILAPYRLAGLS
jgi:uncharacterized phiE125 gp8 family phage protein